jgi:hypothetical protein
LSWLPEVGVRESVWLLTERSVRSPARAAPPRSLRVEPGLAVRVGARESGWLPGIRKEFAGVARCRSLRSFGGCSRRRDLPPSAAVLEALGVLWNARRSVGTGGTVRRESASRQLLAPAGPECKVDRCGAGDTPAAEFTARTLTTRNRSPLNAEAGSELMAPGTSRFA